jgi:hypothetical protein
MFPQCQLRVVVAVISVADQMVIEIRVLDAVESLMDGQVHSLKQAGVTTVDSDRVGVRIHFHKCDSEAMLIDGAAERGEGTVSIRFPSRR